MIVLLIGLLFVSGCQLSLSLWTCPDVSQVMSSASQYVLYIGTGGTELMSLRRDSNTRWVFNVSGSISLSSPTSAIPGVWVSITITAEYTGVSPTDATWSMFINGLLAVSKPGAVTSPTTKATDALLGAHYTPGRTQTRREHATHEQRASLVQRADMRRFLLPFVSQARLTSGWSPSLPCGSVRCLKRKRRCSVGSRPRSW